MKRLILATGNENKVKEMKELLKDLNIEILSKKDAGLENLDIVEDGKTLKENSYKKAITLAKKVDGFVMADDSGLFVDYLNGAPGIHSARYDEEGKGKEKILKSLLNVEESQRTARFKTVITLIDENKNPIYIEGVCEGKISKKELGNNGFGYDPIFIPEGYEETFGELSSEIKNEISHRAKALKELKKQLMEMTNN